MDISNDMDVDMEVTDSPQQNHSLILSWVPPPSRSECLAGLYELYTNEEGQWVIYNWKDSEDARIEPFYNRWPPSRTSAKACSWISVNRGLSPYMQNTPSVELGEKFKGDVGGLRTEFMSIVESGEATVTPELIDNLAVKYGILVGKWMIYAKPGEIDQLWRRVTRVVAFNRGYGQVKVSTRKVQVDDESMGVSSGNTAKWDGGVPIPDQGHVICVYVDNYLDKREVDDLRDALRTRAGVHWAIGFKPDVYTTLNIYKGNKWGLRPSRYHDYDNRKGAGIGRTWV